MELSTRYDERRVADLTAQIAALEKSLQTAGETLAAVTALLEVQTAIATRLEEELAAVRVELGGPRGTGGVQ